MPRLSSGATLAVGGDWRDRGEMKFDAANTPHYAHHARLRRGILRLLAGALKFHVRSLVRHAVGPRTVADRKFTANGSDFTPYVATLGEFCSADEPLVSAYAHLDRQFQHAVMVQINMDPGSCA
jgi:hypothetical protein